MPRHRKRRRMGGMPCLKGFVPFGISKFEKEYIVMQLEEYEALRLADYMGMNQSEAAQKMEISRPTFTRIYESVRKKIAEAFVEGKKIIIEGGDVELDYKWFKCTDCGKVFEKKISKIDGETIINCPFCGSEKVLNLQNCFFRGCRKCKKCHNL